MVGDWFGDFTFWTGPIARQASLITLIIGRHVVRVKLYWPTPVVPSRLCTIFSIRRHKVYSIVTTECLLELTVNVNKERR